MFAFYFYLQCVKDCVSALNACAKGLKEEAASTVKQEVTHVTMIIQPCADPP